MFGKKEPEAPKAPYTMQVLTTRHFIEGTVDGKALFSFTDFPSDAGHYGLLALTDATITPMYSPAEPPRQVSGLGLIVENAIAFVPRAPEGSFEYIDFRTIITGRREGVFLVGPYRVKGTLCCFEDGRFLAQSPMVDVRITREHDDSGWSLDAPVAFVAAQHIEGWEAL